VDTPIDETTCKFLLPAANVRVSAEFEPDIYAVSIGSLSHGAISANPENGLPGTEITLTVTPDEDYRLKSGSLKYTGAAGDTSIDETTLKFSLPGADVTVAAEFEAMPYREIGSAADLAKIGADYPSDGNYILTNDITLNNWTPLCADGARSFSGVFNGNGKTITLQSFSDAAIQNNSYIGIFGYVKGASDVEKATLKNVAIVSSANHASTRDGGQSIGLLAGYAERAVIKGITLSGSFSFSSLIGVVYVGGVAGWIQYNTLVEDCSGSMTLSVTGGYDVPLDPNIVVYSSVGGIVGFFKKASEIRNCHNTGAVSGSAPRPSNALVDERGGVTDTGDLGGGGGTANDPSHAQIFVGGITGGSYYGFLPAADYSGLVENCSSSGNISATAGGWWAFAGGIAGTICGNGDTLPTQITNCAASGQIYAVSAYAYAGGVVAYLYSQARASKCSFTGTLKYYNYFGYGRLAGYISGGAVLSDGDNSIVLTP
jgi:hypothetical protein